ncbi:hypothetical protein HNP69_002752 [Chryseobacterium koreense]|nr:hypothetical protein [Chryseobacterium koreense]
MKFIYSFTRHTFYPLNGSKVEVRTQHSILRGLITWTSTKSFNNELSV